MKETENQLEEEVYVQEVLIELEQLKSCQIKIANNKRDWKEFGKKEDKQPVIPDFIAQSGINANVNEETNTADFLGLFLDDEFFKLSVDQTNLYAAQYIAANPELPPHSRIRKWIDVSIPELKTLLPFFLLIGIVVKPELQQYQSTTPLIKTEFFNNVMPRNHFQLILEFLHFNDKSQYNANNRNCDRSYKLCPVIEYLVNKFKSVYTPDKKVSTDEELLLWKGRLGFKQYIPNKRSRFGIKMFSLCEVSGYPWNRFVYVGKDAVETNEHRELAKNLGKSEAVAPKLMSDLFDKGYHLYIDNWCTSKKLLNFLRDWDTVACGTAMGN